MSEQDVTYSELKFHSSTEQQSRQSVEKTKNEDSSSRLPQLQLILAILGVFCLFLLVTVGVLGAKVLQNENSNEQHEILENLTQLQKTLEICHQQRDDLQTKNTNLTNTVNIEVLQNENSNEQHEILENLTQLQKTLEICHQQRDDLQTKNTNLTNIVNIEEQKPQQFEIVDNLTQLQKTLEICHQERDDLQAKNTNLTNSANIKGDKCRPCPESWIQHEEKCYHFSKEKKTWDKSKEYCSSWGSLLLKIETKEVLGFIKSQDAFYWIGLSRTGQGHGWVWQDGTAYSTNLFPVKMQEPGEKCAVFKAGEAFIQNCTGQYLFICEKRAAPLKTTELSQRRSQYPRQS